MGLLRSTSNGSKGIVPTFCENFKIEELLNSVNKINYKLYLRCEQRSGKNRYTNNGSYWQ